MKIFATLILSALLSLGAVAQTGPNLYIVRGVASGSLDGVAFSQEPFTLAMEGSVENLSAGSVPYIAGDHPNWDWFSQDPLDRIVFSVDNTIGTFLNPSGFQLLSANFGAYFPIYGGVPSAPFTVTSLCGSGQDQYACWESANFSLANSQPVDFRSASGPASATFYGYSPSFDTTRGGLVLAGLDGATFEVRPVPEPDTYTLVLVGLAVVGFVVKRRAA